MRGPPFGGGPSYLHWLRRFKTGRRLRPAPFLCSLGSLGLIGLDGVHGGEKDVSTLKLTRERIPSLCQMQKIFCRLRVPGGQRQLATVPRVNPALLRVSRHLCALPNPDRIHKRTAVRVSSSIHPNHAEEPTREVPCPLSGLRRPIRQNVLAKEEPRLTLLVRRSASRDSPASPPAGQARCPASLPCGVPGCQNGGQSDDACPINCHVCFPAFRDE